MRHAEIVIVGAGVIGASIAWHLAVRGCRDVLVIDRESEPGGGSTSKATGGFRAQFGTAVNVRMSLLSREKLLRFRDETGVDPGYESRGYLFLARSEHEMEQLGAALAVQHACGLHEARLITEPEAKAINPAIGDEEVIGGAFCPTDGFIRPMNILAGYIAAATRLGVRFEWGVLCRSIAELKGGTIVNAAGAWAAALADVAVTPLRRNILPSIETDVLPESMPMTIWLSDGFHLRVRDSRVLLLWPDDPPLDDERWIEEIVRRAHERVPVLREVAVDRKRRWSGLYEMSPDRHAIVGRHPRIPNLVLANGSSGHGVMHAPALGQLVAEIILDGKATTIDIGALGPSRFEEGAAVSGDELL